MTPLLAHPGLPLLVAAALVAVLPRRAASALVLAAPAAALALVVTGRGSTGPTVELYGIALSPLRIDGLATVFAGTFTVASFLVGLYGLRTAGRAERVAGLVTASAAIGVALAGDLVTLFLWWELKAVATTVVVLVGGTAASRSAGRRYLAVHLVGGSALLAGIGWHAASTGSTAFDLLDGGAGAALIAVGLLVSAAAVPVHTWLPDAYPTASVAGTVLLSAFTTKAAVYALARGFAGVDALVWVGVAMALYGVAYAMVQDDLRRLLSYHIVSQVGFMVAAIGVGTDEAIDGATAHAAAHIVYKGLLLMGVGAVIHATGRTRATELGGLARALPAVLVLYLVGALSISGVPLLSGFVSKELSLHAIGEAGLPVAVLALKAASVGTALSTLGKLPWATWVARPPSGTVPPLVRRVPPTMYVAMGLAAALCVAVGVAPRLLWDQLPHAEAHDPFSVAEVAQALLLLALAALAFLLLRRRLAPHAGDVPDVDHVPRVLVPAWAGRVRAAVRRRAEERPVPRPGSGAVAAARAWLGAPPATWATVWLGVALTGAAALLLAGSLW